MTHSARSLASLLRDGLQTLEYRRSSGVAPEEPNYVLLEQGHGQTHPQAQAKPPLRTLQGPVMASEQEVRDYLASLAKAYDLPTELVHAVAKTESTFDPNKVHKNPPHRDRHGRPVPGSTDYGLMQINSRKIGRELVKDPQGNKFKIGEDVKSDWKANARAGVAVLAEQYKVAEIEQGAVTSEKDRAQQAYSGYNGGNGNRNRYLHETRDGLPHNKNDQHFLQNYLDEKKKR
ncbi:MAG TPA: transglycosylase SLT domain-containing protein [Candidatus Acidoferrum sp.]